MVLLQELLHGPLFRMFVHARLLPLLHDALGRELWRWPVPMLRRSFDAAAAPPLAAVLIAPTMVTIAVGFAQHSMRSPAAAVAVALSVLLGLAAAASP